MLIASDLKAVYGGVVLALERVSLTVPEASIVALLGSNGSGKSTTLKSMSGVLRAEDGDLTEGRVELDGRRIDGRTPEQIARLGVCHVLQGRTVFQQLTTEENLLMGAYLRRDRRGIREDLARAFEYFPALEPLRSRRSGYLSGGEQQMLVIARALMSRPHVLLLDEPSLGLAPNVVGELFSILRRIRDEENTAMLVAEQNATAALGIADFGYILQGGRVVSSGPAAQVGDNAQVRGAYLGLSEGGTFLSRHDVRKAASDGDRDA